MLALKVVCMLQKREASSQHGEYACIVGDIIASFLHLCVALDPSNLSWGWLNV